MSFILGRPYGRPPATYPKTRNGPLLTLQAGSVFLFGLAPHGVYPATDFTTCAGALLPHPFTLTARRIGVGGLLSVALAVGFPPGR